MSASRTSGSGPSALGRCAGSRAVGVRAILAGGLLGGRVALELLVEGRARDAEQARGGGLLARAVPERGGDGEAPFWYAIGLVRYEIGELDEYVDGLERVELGEALWS